MGCKLPWGNGELDALVANPESKVVLVQSQLPVVLEPFHLQHLKSAVKGILDQLLDSYQKSLNGIVLSYKRLKILSTSGAVGAETSGISVDTHAEFYVFRPEVGCILKGVVNKTSKDHVGVLLHKRFNVSCPRPSRYIENDNWIGSKVQMHQEVTFKLKELNLSSRLPYFKGKLISCGESVSSNEESVSKTKLKKGNMKEIEEGSSHDHSKVKNKKRQLLDDHEEVDGKSKKLKKMSEGTTFTQDISSNSQLKSPKGRMEAFSESSLSNVTSNLSINSSPKKKKKSKDKTLEAVPAQAMMQEHVKLPKAKKQKNLDMVDSTQQPELSLVQKNLTSPKEKKSKNVSISLPIVEQAMASVLQEKDKLKKEKKKKRTESAITAADQMTSKSPDKKSKRRSIGTDEVDFIPRMAMNESFLADSQLLDNLPPPNADSTHFDLGRTRLSIDPRSERKKKNKSEALSDIKEETSLHHSIEVHDISKKNKKSGKSKTSVPISEVLSTTKVDISPKKKKKSDSVGIVPLTSTDMLEEPPTKKKKTKDKVEVVNPSHEKSKLSEQSLKKDKKKKKDVPNGMEIMSPEVASVDKFLKSTQNILSSPSKKVKKSKKITSKEALGLETSGIQPKVKTGQTSTLKLSQESPKGEAYVSENTGIQTDSDDEIMPCGQRTLSPPLHKSFTMNPVKSPGFGYVPVVHGEIAGHISPPDSPTFLEAARSVRSDSDSDAPSSPKKIVVSKRTDTSSDSDSDAPAQNLKQSLSKMPSNSTLSGNHNAESCDSDSEDASKPVSKILQSMGVMQSPLKTVQSRKGAGTSGSDSDSSGEKCMISKLPTAPKSILKTRVKAEVKPAHSLSDDSDSDAELKNILAKLPLLAAKPPTKRAPKKAPAPKIPTKTATKKAPVKKSSKSLDNAQGASLQSPSKKTTKVCNESSTNVKLTTNDASDSDSDMEQIRTALKSLSEPAVSKIHAPAKFPLKSSVQAANSPRKNRLSSKSQLDSPSKNCVAFNDKKALEALKPFTDGDSGIKHKPVSKKLNVKKNLSSTSDSDSGPDDRNTTLLMQEHREKVSAEISVAQKKLETKKQNTIKKNIKTNATTAAKEATATEASKGTGKVAGAKKSGTAKPSKKEKQSDAKPVKDVKVEKGVGKESKKKQKKSNADNAISDIMQKLLKQANMKLGLS